ncbi:NUDIX hydrolase [Streptomyces alboflavus]|uniref:NUDIX hydrolase n=1 Tax=Streptomyces alboflavus TaxID=67267 RepID=A0A1Z1WS90_9ACTN|nr:NUDIX domain-containing protein [Streptomyces alboflavus]ARX89300.1 NUDIX hydrolase [Streptomyces alboflavus]
MTFIHQLKGPYAGSWLLPGGGIERGEAAEAAALRGGP